MLTDKKYGLSVNWMATHAMPSLLPHTVNPKLNLEQFILLLEVLQDMLNNIERQVQLALRSGGVIYASRMNGSIAERSAMIPLAA